MAYAILRTEKLKTFDKLKIVNNHHFRKHDVKNADSEKTQNNIRLIDCNDNLIEAVKNRIAERKIRKNGVIAVEILMTASPEFFRDDPKDYGVYDKDTVDQFNRYAMNYLKKEFGEENVVSAICHLDEATPHIQAIIVPVDFEKNKNGKLNASKWLDGRKLLSEMQDRYFEAMERLGLERGMKGSESEHTTIKQFYGVLESAEILNVPQVSISTPPVMIKEKSREDWSNDESERINDFQQPVFQNISNKAAISALASKKKKEAEKTAKKYAEELERMKKEANLVRDIDLRIVMLKLNAKVITKNKVYELNGEQISIDKQKFFNHYQNIGGGGAIDLVMQTQGFNFKDAVSWLGGNIDKKTAVGAAMFHAKREATEAVKAPAPLPEPVERHWPHVRDYLIKKRGISEKIVDWLHEKNMVFADFMQNACFSYGSQGVEKTGTRGKKWRGFVGSKKEGFTLRSTKNPLGVVFVESAIDAISFAELRQIDTKLAEFKDFDVISVGGVSTDTAGMIATKYDRVVVGFDNDTAGDKGYERLKEAVDKDVERLKPEQPRKDWNDYVKLQEQEQSGGSQNEDQNEDQDRGMKI